LACSGSSFDVGSVSDATSGADSTEVDSAATDSAADTSTTPDTGGEVALKCGDESTFPKLIKGCTGDENCSFGLHQTSCCGSLVAIGFNHAEKTKFDATEAAWRATCPACGCPPAPTVDELGKTGTSFQVKCDGGKCIAHAN
ncbi:MAG: hypothetical protein ACXVEF_11910, partial [Polyangiales bacterium]